MKKHLKKYSRKQKSFSVALFLEPECGSIASLKWSKKDALPRLEIVSPLSFPAKGEQQKILNKAIRHYNLQKSTCISVLPSDCYQIIQVDMGELPLEEGREAARWNIQEQIDYPPEEAVIDLFDVSPFDSEKTALTYAVSARESMLREHLKVLRQVGLTPIAIDIPEFALRNLCDLFTEDTLGLAILLLLEHSSILVIVREGALYLARNLSTGMNDLLPYADGQYEELTDRLGPIVLEVQRSFDHCESSLRLPGISRLLVAQTQREIPTVINYLDEYLATRVEAFSFKGILEVPTEIEQIELNNHLLAIGGALRQESQ